MVPQCGLRETRNPIKNHVTVLEIKVSCPSKQINCLDSHGLCGLCRSVVTTKELGDSSLFR